jgi:4'-phosphopantetheinyl transferase
LIKSNNVDKAGDLLMKKYVSKSAKDITYNKFGKPYLKSKKIHFNLTHTVGYAALAVSEKHEIGLDIERLDRKTDFRFLIMSRFNLQLYNRLNSQTEFIKY